MGPLQHAMTRRALAAAALVALGACHSLLDIDGLHVGELDAGGAAASPALEGPQSKDGGGAVSGGGGSESGSGASGASAGASGMGARGGSGAGGSAGDDAGRGGSGAGGSASGTGGSEAAGRGGSEAAGRGGSEAAGSGGSSGSGDAGSSGSAAGSGGSDAPAPHCLDGITNYASDGPFSYTTFMSGSVRMYVPDLPLGCKVPVIHFANGTNATCTGTYSNELRHLAKHGFLTVCYEEGSSGAGTGCVSALLAAFQEVPAMADRTKIGSAGHLEGGAGALICLQKAKEHWPADVTTYAGFAAAPMSGFGMSPGNWAELFGMVRQPVVVFHATGGMFVSPAWVGSAFEALDPRFEAYWYAAVGATDTPPPTSWFNEADVAWFRWKLLGDQQACRHFLALPDGARWDQSGAHTPNTCK